MFNYIEDPCGRGTDAKLQLFKPAEPQRRRVIVYMLNPLECNLALNLLGGTGMMPWLKSLYINIIEWTRIRGTTERACLPFTLASRPSPFTQLPQEAVLHHCRLSNNTCVAVVTALWSGLLKAVYLLQGRSWLFPSSRRGFRPPRGPVCTER